MGRQYPFGVWMLLTCGERWMYSRHKTLDDAMLTARALRGDRPLFPTHPVWIAAPDGLASKNKPRRTDAVLDTPMPALATT